MRAAVILTPVELDVLLPMHKTQEQLRLKKAITSVTGWCVEYEKLNKQQNQLELACLSCTGFCKTVGESIKHSQLALRRIRAHLAKRASSLSAQMQQTQSNCKSGEEDNITRLKKKFIRLEQDISSLQESSVAQLQQLAAEEAEAASVLDDAHKVVLKLLRDSHFHTAQKDMCSSSEMLSSEMQAHQNRKEQGQCTPPNGPSEVGKCEEFVRKFGVTGGWYPDAQKDFETIWNACKGSFSHAVQICCERMNALYSYEQIVQHARCAYLFFFRCNTHSF